MLAERLVDATQQAHVPRAGNRSHTLACEELTAQVPSPRRLQPVITQRQPVLASRMMVMYALERRDARFILAFACGCLLSSAYAFLAGVWPFGVVEVIWAAVAAVRYRRFRE